MKYFKNENQQINGDVTNIKACKAPQAPEDGINWIECDESEVEHFTQLYMIGDVRYFGRL